MVEVPFHPQIVHLPLALSVILPLMALAVTVCIRKQKFTSHVWILVACLQVLTTGSGYLAMETGEDDEQAVGKLIGKPLVHAHEEKAEMFVAFSVAASAVAIATVVVKTSAQFYLMLVTILLMLGQSALGWRVGRSGGELIYVHKAANAHVPAAPPVVEEESDEPEYAADETNEDEEEREHDDEKDE